MKALVVDHFPVVPQQFHDDLEMLTRIYILCHDIVIRSIQEYLAQKLDRLSFGDIAFRSYEHLVVLGEEGVEVCL